MPTGDVVLFDIGETLGAVFDDSSRRAVRNLVALLNKIWS
jgi:hypothetical protein